MKRISVKFLLLMAVLVLGAADAFGQKKPLDHSVYDSWERISGVKVPYNGKFVVYSISPQQGDGVLYLYDTQTKKTVSLDRATRPVISRDGSAMVALVKPLYQQSRQAKIDKKKAPEAPTDTLAVMNLYNGEVEKYPAVEGFQYGKDLKEFVVFRKAQLTKADKDARDLLVLNFRNNSVDTLKRSDSYRFAENGSKLVYTTKPDKKDSLGKKEIHIYDPYTQEDHIIFSADPKLEFSLPVFNEQATAVAFYAQPDTAKANKDFRTIYYAELNGKDTAKVLVNNQMAGVPEGMMISPKRNLEFAKDNSFLAFGLKEIPEKEDESVPDFEKVKLDIWVWDADYTPVTKKYSKARFDRMTYAALYYFDNQSQVVVLADENVPNVVVDTENNHGYTLAISDKKYRIEQQWDAVSKYDLYNVNMRNGEKELLQEQVRYTGFSSSPDGNYLTYYNVADTTWYLYDIHSGNTRDLTSEVDDIFWDDEEDMPVLPYPAGGTTWFEDGSHFVIRAKYDLWLFDVKGDKKPLCLTEGLGKQNKTRFALNNQLLYDVRKENNSGAVTEGTILADKPLIITGFNTVTKYSSIYMKELAARKPKMKLLVEGPYTYNLLGEVVSYEYPGIEDESKVRRRPRREISVPVIVYTKGDFENPYDLYVTSDLFRTEQKLTDINPWQEDYNWGTVEMVYWKTEDGIDAEGLLYKPEDFDPAKKYPMLVYFYEKDSDGLYTYKTPAPSRSIINIPYCVSNGYIVFVPNIYYTDGHPGQSAMRSIMPGVEMLCQNPWVDSEKMALQGQSWGGYQTAYMITQTDRFAAAGAGAPVSNMTSAYGGIRWESGRSRQSQYEHTQSRIGKDLWEGFDLYIENSPVFFAPNVKTPLLIMHNDNDGAVPWYQGIEYFMALRRLGKPAWMLQYNGEAHNLVHRHNCMDYSVKLMEFFDHYLKGAPKPSWME